MSAGSESHTHAQYTQRLRSLTCDEVGLPSSVYALRSPTSEIAAPDLCDIEWSRDVDSTFEASFSLPDSQLGQTANGQLEISPVRPTFKIASFDLCNVEWSRDVGSMLEASATGLMALPDLQLESSPVRLQQYCPDAQWQAPSKHSVQSNPGDLSVSSCTSNVSFEFSPPCHRMDSSDMARAGINALCAETALPLDLESRWPSEECSGAASIDLEASPFVRAPDNSNMATLPVPPVCNDVPFLRRFCVEPKDATLRQKSELDRSCPPREFSSACSVDSESRPVVLANDYSDAAALRPGCNDVPYLARLDVVSTTATFKQTLDHCVVRDEIRKDVGVQVPCGEDAVGNSCLAALENQVATLENRVLNLVERAVAQRAVWQARRDCAKTFAAWFRIKVEAKRYCELEKKRGLSVRLRVHAKEIMWKAAVAICAAKTRGAARRAFEGWRGMKRSQRDAERTQKVANAVRAFAIHSTRGLIFAQEQHVMRVAWCAWHAHRLIESSERHTRAAWYEAGVRRNADQYVRDTLSASYARKLNVVSLRFFFLAWSILRTGERNSFMCSSRTAQALAAACCMRELSVLLAAWSGQLRIRWRRAALQNASKLTCSRATSVSILYYDRMLAWAFAEWKAAVLLTIQARNTVELELHISDLRQRVRLAAQYAAARLRIWWARYLLVVWRWIVLEDLMLSLRGCSQVARRTLMLQWAIVVWRAAVHISVLQVRSFHDAQRSQAAISRAGSRLARQLCLADCDAMLRRNMDRQSCGHWHSESVSLGVILGTVDVLSAALTAQQCLTSWHRCLTANRKPPLDDSVLYQDEWFDLSEISIDAWDERLELSGISNDARVEDDDFLGRNVEQRYGNTVFEKMRSSRPQSCNQHFLERQPALPRKALSVMRHRACPALDMDSLDGLSSDSSHSMADLATAPAGVILPVTHETSLKRHFGEWRVRKPHVARTVDSLKRWCEVLESAEARVKRMEGWMGNHAKGRK